MTHTPGPWNLPKWAKDNNYQKVWSRGGIIATVEGRRGGKILSEQKLFDNARLIAAAPDLLEACEKAQAKLRATQENWREQCLFECDDILTAVIAKAKGES